MDCTGLVVDRIHACRELNSAVLRNPVSQKPSDDERLSHRIITPPSQSMFLMADLRKLDGYGSITVCVFLMYIWAACLLSGYYPLPPNTVEPYIKGHTSLQRRLAMSRGSIKDTS